MRPLLSTALVAFLSVAAAIGQDNPLRQANNAAQAASTNKITGRCHCGHIAYAADAVQAKSDDCQCRGCQRASGSLQAHYIIVPPAAVRITSTGEPAEFRAKSGVECDAWGVWQYCPKCGSPLFWKSKKEDKINIFAGTLDDIGVYKPRK